MLIAFIILIHGVKFNVSAKSTKGAKKGKIERGYRKRWIAFMDAFNELKIESYFILFISILMTMILNMSFRDACFVKSGESPYSINFNYKAEHYSYSTNMYRMLNGYTQRCPEGICYIYSSLAGTPSNSVMLFVNFFSFLDFYQCDGFRKKFQVETNFNRQKTR